LELGLDISLIFFFNSICIASSDSPDLDAADAAAFCCATSRFWSRFCRLDLPFEQQDVSLPIW